MNNPDPQHTAREALIVFADRLAAEDLPTQDQCVTFAREVAEEYPGGKHFALPTGWTTAPGEAFLGDGVTATWTNEFGMPAIGLLTDLGEVFLTEATYRGLIAFAAPQWKPSASVPGQDVLALDEVTAERDRLRALVDGPLVTRHADGDVTLTWPDGADRAVITRELLEAVNNEHRRMRAEIARLRSDLSRGIR